MSIWHGNPTERYAIKVLEGTPLPEGFVLLADEAARDAWTASLMEGTPTWTDDDYTKELNARIDAVARQMRYKHIESMKGYAGFVNEWQAECLPFAQWDARLWKKVGELEANPPAGPAPSPKQFADLVFALVPPPPNTNT
jgi:hypothetical protein